MSSTDNTTDLFKTYGVLGSILGQASAMPGWDEGITSAGVRWNGAIEVHGVNEALGTAMSEGFGLHETSRSTRRPRPLYAGDDTRRIAHYISWEGTYLGHRIEIRAYWCTPLGDLDLAEGEELA
jgi:hypothetical protein